MGKLVRAREGFQTPDGFVVAPGDLLSANHPYAKTYKDLMEEVDEKEYVRFYVAPRKEKKSERVVEATKPPGKKRGQK